MCENPASLPPADSHIGAAACVESCIGLARWQNGSLKAVGSVVLACRILVPATPCCSGTSYHSSCLKGSDRQLTSSDMTLRPSPTSLSSSDPAIPLAILCDDAGVVDRFSNHHLLACLAVDIARLSSGKPSSW